MGIEEKRRNRHKFWVKLKRQRVLQIFAWAGIIYLLIFNYAPMAGILVAFKKYSIKDGFWGIFTNEWAGLKYFREFFSDYMCWPVIKNTLIISFLKILTSFPAPILLAIMLTEVRNRHFKKFVQAVSYLPYFISWVIVGAFVYNIFNYETGLMNGWLTSLGMEKVNVYSMPWVWPIIICCFNAWKWCGYNSIIYIAAITGIDGECYEAAQIDGANIFQRIWYITLPCIKPTVITMLLLQVGRILRGDFEMFYQIVGNNGQLYNATDVIDTYVFRSLMQNSNLGMTAAATFYQSILCFIIIMLVNAVVKKIDEDYALF